MKLLCVSDSLMLDSYTVAIKDLKAMSKILKDNGNNDGSTFCGLMSSSLELKKKYVARYAESKSQIGSKVKLELNRQKEDIESWVNKLTSNFAPEKIKWPAGTQDNAKNDYKVNYGEVLLKLILVRSEIVSV